MYLVTKRIEFCYGHRLLDYDGVCKHPHGHNAIVEVEVRTDRLDSRNMVVPGLVAVIISILAALLTATVALDLAASVVIYLSERHAPGSDIHSLGDALFLQAFAALNNSPGARAFYDRQRARGATHYQALRTLANRLVGILHGCLRTHTLYDEHLAWHSEPDKLSPAA